MSILYVYASPGAAPAVPLCRLWRFFLALFALLLLLVAQHASAAAPRPDKAPRSLLSLPVAAQGAISARLGRDESAYHARLRDSGLTAENREHGYAIEFGPQGPRVVAGSGHFKLALAGVGYGARLQAVESVSPKTQANRVEYPRGVLTEWYANGPLGLEQGFTLKHRPAGAQEGPLTLAFDLSGTLNPAVDGNTLILSAPGSGAVLRYRGLTALDARGRELPARLALTGGTLRIEVDERNAAYPLTIDPFIEEATITASDGTTGHNFGWSVVLSADRRTALIGAFDAPCAAGAQCGAAYVFVREKSGAWVEQQKLTASDAAELDNFGGSVDLSAHGKTALIGANGVDCPVVLQPEVDTVCGAAYVFVREKSGAWVEQQKLTASDAAEPSFFGSSVALSARGRTALIAAQNAPCPGGGTCGAAYVFVHGGNTWVEQQKLTASEPTDGLGGAVALSARGQIALIGGGSNACPASESCGAAYIFLKKNGTWVEQQKLTASDAAEVDQFGSSVALSARGQTALIGALTADCPVGEDCGAAYVFVRKGNEWVERQKLTASDAAAGDAFGFSVALSAGGKTVLIGAPDADYPVGENCGAAYVFVRHQGIWVEQQRFESGSSGNFGFSVALSARTALIGAPQADGCPVGFCGVAYIFRK